MPPIGCSKLCGGIRLGHVYLREVLDHCVVCICYSFCKISRRLKCLFWISSWRNVCYLKALLRFTRESRSDHVSRCRDRYKWSWSRVFRQVNRRRLKCILRKPSIRVWWMRPTTPLAAVGSRRPSRLSPASVRSCLSPGA